MSDPSTAARARLAATLPTFGLRVTSGDLELRLPDDADLLDLADVAAAGVHAADASPFLFPWARGTADEVRRNVLRYHWRARPVVSPEHWVLELGVYLEGRVVGVQAVSAESFLVTRAATTGSWLGRPYQGRGLGTRARLMALHLAFEGLGAREMRTEAFADNAASNAVTRRLGYAPNGVLTVAREGAAAVQHQYLLTRQAWDARPEALRPGVRLSGLGPVREVFGIA